MLLTSDCPKATWTACMKIKLIRFKVLPGSSLYPISSAVIWKAELKHPKNLKAECLILRQKSFWPLPEHSHWCVFSSSASTNSSSMLAVSQMPVSGVYLLQSKPSPESLFSKRNSEMPITSIGKSLWGKVFQIEGVREDLLLVWDLPFGSCSTAWHWTDFNFVFPFSFLSSVFSAVSLGFYLFSPNHSDPVSILTLSLRIQPDSAVIVYSMWDQTLAALRLPGSVTLLYPLLGRKAVEGSPSRTGCPKGNILRVVPCSWCLHSAKRATCHCPQGWCLGQSLATSTAVVRVQQPLVPTVAQAVAVKMCFWFNPSHSISQGTLERPSAEVLFPREGIRELWECHIHRGGGTGCFFEQNVPVNSCLHFVMGIYFFQYFNTLENSLVNLFVLLTTSK